MMTPRRVLRDRRLLRAVLATLALAALTLGAAADEPPDATEQSGGRVRITLEDGSVLVGRIASESDEGIEVAFSGGGTAHVPRDSVVSIAPLEAASAPAGGETSEPDETRSRVSRFRRNDPNHTRLFFAPTGRPLGKGEWQFADYFAVLPGFAAGLTEHLSLLGGISALPGLGLSEQLVYVAPRLAFQTSRRSSFSAGVLYLTVGSEADREGAGIAFAVGTIGEPEASVSAGLGYGFITDEGEFERADKPIVMVGGERQLTDSLALVTESWLILDADADDWPFGVGLRFFGDKISVDIGVILMKSVLEEGFPAPWLSFSYRFDRSKSSIGATRGSDLTPLLPRWR